MHLAQVYGEVFFAGNCFSKPRCWDVLQPQCHTTAVGWFLQSKAKISYPPPLMFSRDRSFQGVNLVAGGNRSLKLTWILTWCNGRQANKARGHHIQQLRNAGNLASLHEALHTCLILLRHLLQEHVAAIGQTDGKCSHVAAASPWWLPPCASAQLSFLISGQTATGPL